MTTLVDAPERVDGVQLIGEMSGSGYRTPPALVRRADGQVLQLTPLLYLVLGAADGRRTCAEIGELVGPAIGRSVSEDDVRALVDSHLRPLGLLRLSDGSEPPELRRSNPLLALKPRVAVTDEETTRRLTAPFTVLFRPVLVVLVLLGYLAVVGWVFFERGLAASAYDAFERPHLLLLVFVVSVLSGGFHEFGHAAAVRYSGGRPGAMGAGLYLVWPAFYTDVTDSYRLDRLGRIRTDLGGLYFNALVVVATFVWWWATGWEALLLLVATQVLQMVQQVLPLLRFDGYHVLADLAGVPDLYHRLRPTLVGLLPHRWRSPENRVLTPWARLIITVWVLVTVPMMALMLLGVVRAVPRLVGTAGSAVQEKAGAAGRALADAAPVDAAAGTLQLLMVVLPVLACALVLSRIGFRSVRGLLRWSRGSMGRRGVAVVVVAAAVAVLAWAWWPAPDNYRPIQPGERGLLTAVLQSRSTAAGDHVDPHPSSAGQAARTRLSSGRPMVAAFPRDRDLPTREQPTLALVLVPTQSGPGSTSGSGSTTAGDSAEPWVFPFDQPLPPDAGDNQALAVATRDGEVTYDVAFALVWADGDQVLNVNEAHAYASCSDCVAVAVAFQVVLILDDAQVVVPQNLAVAANYDCHRCITAAVASQLVLSLDAPPGQEELRQLAEVWNRLLEFANTITSYSLEEITSQLEAFKSEILAILGQAPPVETAPTTTTPTTSTQPTSTSTQTTATATQTPTVEEPGETPPSPTTSSPSTTSPTSPTSSPTGDATPTSGSTAPEATPTTAPTSTASP